MFYILVKDNKILSVNLDNKVPDDGIRISDELANLIIFDESNYWTYENETIIATPIIVESFKIASVSIRQARKALYQLGYLESIESYMTMNGSEEDKIDWQFATEVRRDHPLVGQMRQLLQLTEQDINNLFLLANTL